ncbi:MAG: alpha/beta hydrolase family protein [Ignavibacteria bacterium]
MNFTRKSFRFLATKSSGEVGAILMQPEKAEWLMVLAHGAGAGMQNKFMEKISIELVNNGIASFRYNFPYMEHGKKSPDPKPIILMTIRSAVEAAAKILPGIPILAGGKSFGGRMTSTADSENHLINIKGIVFFGFPLHPPGKPSAERAEHLFKVSVPMLFLQGKRDSLADLKLLKPICKKLGTRAHLHIIEGANHSFHMPKSSGINDDDVIKELAEKVKEWAVKLIKL